MGFEGFFKASKDYLQPVLMTAAFPVTTLLFTGIHLRDEQRSVFLIGPVYFLLFIASAIASRNAYRIASLYCHEDQAARFIWGLSILIFSALLASMYYGIYWIIISGYVLLYIIQNIWRPILISRFDDHSDERKGAIVLSIESQAKSLSTMIIAPIMGLAIDHARYGNVGVSEFWPIGIFGLILAVSFYLTAIKEKKEGLHFFLLCLFQLFQ